MCGRDAAFYTWREIHAFSQPLALATPAEDPAPNYNRAPTQRGWTIVATEDGPAAVEMRWGLLPPWAKDTRLAYTIITRDADPVIQDVHDRMPLILPPIVLEDWLDGTVDAAAGILASAPEPPLVYYPVDRAVGNVRNTGPQLVEPV